MSAREQDVLARIKQAIHEIDPTATAILFSSRATGKAREDSDWDVLILLNKASMTLNDELPFRDSLYDVKLEIGEAISTFFYTNKDWNTRQSGTPLH